MTSRTKIFLVFKRHNVDIRMNSNLVPFFINWRDVQTKNVVNNVDMSSLRAPWQNGPYKKLTQRTTQKHVQHHDATDI